MLEKFRGALYGVLVGDCFGALFQESSILTKGSRLVLKNFLDSLEKSTASAGLRKSYTDDTALTLAVARTLNTCKHIDQRTLAINFVDEFYKNPYRGFNNLSIEIFSKLKHTNFEDVLWPAKETLMSDSCDNGCAMYVAPLALVSCKNAEINLKEQVQTAAALTHLHELAIDGAVLQANAIRNLANSNGQLDIDAFLDELIESTANGSSQMESPSFGAQVAQVKKLLIIQNPSEERIVNVLGHSQQALYSVPTAIYCFLRSVKYPSDTNPFRQAIEYGITLGGHSNTIASMTGALCGAYYGDSVISTSMLQQCEGFDEIKEISHDLCQN